ncbi:MAG: ABC transporter permease [Anaerolineae bacterium]|nr:ABC transporter permease [Anaerolineae bacterium]
MQSSKKPKVPSARRGRRNGRPLSWEQLLAPLVLVAAIALWDLVVHLAQYPAFILPTPGRVWARFLEAWHSGTLQMHTWVTLQEIFGGLALGLSVAVILGYLLAKSRPLEKLLSPYIVASQAVPIVALAPLLVIWFGAGSLSKMLVCALTIFFPVLVNTIVGIRSVDAELLDLMRSFEASKWQIFKYLELPAALPILLGGLKIGVTLSVIGAVVGEFVGADRGLGFLVNLARGLFDTPLMFVALFTLMAIALLLYLIVSGIEAWLLKWRWPED